MPVRSCLRGRRAKSRITSYFRLPGRRFWLAAFLTQFMPFSDDPAAGVFSAAPKIEFIDTPAVPNRNVRVLEDFTFTQASDGSVWDAPAGSIVDGASIPQVLWSFVGSPFTGDYFYASIVHDVACDARTRPWRTVHYMFYQACLAGGTTRLRAKLMYLAVRNFGPRWPDASPSAHFSFGVRAHDLAAAAQRNATVDYESQVRYLRRAQEYLDTHGSRASIEATDVYASQSN